MLKLYIPEHKSLAPLYENKDTPIPLYLNTDSILDLGNSANELVELTKIMIVPQFDRLVYKSISYGLSVLAGEAVVDTTLDRLANSTTSILKELDIYYQPKELQVYSFTPENIVDSRTLILRLEINGTEDYNHLLSHVDVNKIYIRKGKELSQVSISYLDTLSLEDMDSIVLEFILPLDSTPIKKIFNFLIVSVSKYIKRIANIYSNIYDFSAVRYGRDVFTPVSDLSDLNDSRLKYIVNSDYIYLI
jgi:hypothetical protein